MTDGRCRTVAVSGVVMHESPELGSGNHSFTFANKSLTRAAVGRNLRGVERSIPPVN
jgi:hypothetical protein